MNYEHAHSIFAAPNGCGDDSPSDGCGDGMYYGHGDGDGNTCGDGYLRGDGCISRAMNGSESNGDGYGSGWFTNEYGDGWDGGDPSGNGVGFGD